MRSTAKEPWPPGACTPWALLSRVNVCVLLATQGVFHQLCLGEQYDSPLLHWIHVRASVAPLACMRSILACWSGRGCVGWAGSEDGTRGSLSVGAPHRSAVGFPLQPTPVAPASARSIRAPAPPFAASTQAIPPSSQAVPAAAQAAPTQAITAAAQAFPPKATPPAASSCVSCQPQPESLECSCHMCRAHCFAAAHAHCPVCSPAVCINGACVASSIAAGQAANTEQQPALAGSALHAHTRADELFSNTGARSAAWLPSYHWYRKEAGGYTDSAVALHLVVSSLPRKHCAVRAEWGWDA